MEPSERDTSMVPSFVFDASLRAVEVETTLQHRFDKGVVGTANALLRCTRTSTAVRRRYTVDSWSSIMHERRAESGSERMH